MHEFHACVCIFVPQNLYNIKYIKKKNPAEIIKKNATCPLLRLRGAQYLANEPSLTHNLCPTTTGIMIRRRRNRLPLRTTSSPLTTIPKIQVSFREREATTTLRFFIIGLTGIGSTPVSNIGWPTPCHVTSTSFPAAISTPHH